jgi:hypothetical protein
VRSICLSRRYGCAQHAGSIHWDCVIACRALSNEQPLSPRPSKHQAATACSQEASSRQAESRHSQQLPAASAATAPVTPAASPHQPAQQPAGEPATSLPVALRRLSVARQATQPPGFHRRHHRRHQPLVQTPMPIDLVATAVGAFVTGAAQEAGKQVVAGSSSSGKSTKSGGTTYSGSGRPRKSDYTKGGNVRR